MELAGLEPATSWVRSGRDLSPLVGIDRRERLVRRVRSPCVLPRLPSLGACHSAEARRGVPAAEGRARDWPAFGFERLVVEAAELVERDQRSAGVDRLVCGSHLPR